MTKQPTICEICYFDNRDAEEDDEREMIECPGCNTTICEACLADMAVEARLMSEDEAEEVDTEDLLFESPDTGQMVCAKCYEEAEDG